MDQNEKAAQMLGGMKTVRRFESTNGQWGLEIVSRTVDEVKVDDTRPIRGTARYLGRRAGRACVQIEKDETAQTWILVCGDVTLHEGAVSVASESLQSSNTVTVVAIGPSAVIETHGYKRRSSDLSLYVDGAVVPEAGPGVMLALGILDPTQEVDAETTAPSPPAPSTAFAEALRAAGIRRAQ